MSYGTESIKNLVLAGHGGSGKTTLFERLLFAAGVIAKPEEACGGKSVSSNSPEEVERKISIYSALAGFEYKGKKLNFFDTPGASDFIGEAILCFRAANIALFAVDSRSGVQIETIKLWRGLENKSRGVIVTKIDDERSDFKAALADIKEKFKLNPVPFTIPMGEGADFKGVIDVLNEKAYIAGADGTPEKAADIPPEYRDAVVEARLKLMEIAADGDEILMEKYILLGSLEPDDILKGLKSALELNLYVPAFACAALKNSGVIPLLEFAAEIAPDSGSAPEFILNEEGVEEVKFDNSAPLLAFVIKTVFDQFSGKMSWVKVIRGTLNSDAEIFNIREKKKERIGKLYTACGKKLNEVKSVTAGDIGIITKSASLKTNDTIGAADNTPRLMPLKHPEPVYSVSIEGAAKKDDAKIGDFLNRAAEEDKTFRCVFNPETKETVISGMGELHINIMLDKLKQSQKVELVTNIPRVAYRETITKKSGAEYTHKKQTGGHGQYGRVVLEIAPRGRGEGYNFINAIFGGAIPKNYIPGVEKGIAEAMQRGVLASYPVVDVEVKLVDGKYHPVDSSELSFSLAARSAFREAMKQAAPVLLEPVMNLTVFVESKYLGDVLSDLSVKRGKISGQNSIGGGIEEIRAQVPQNELLRYSIDLRSITSGTGSFSVEESHYAPPGGRIAEDIIKAAAAFKVQESEE